MWFQYIFWCICCHDNNKICPRELIFINCLSDGRKTLISPSISSVCDSFLVFIPYPTSLNEKKNIKTSGERKTDATQYKTQNIGFPFEISCGLHGLHGIIHHVCTLPEISTLHENNSGTISQALQSCPSDDPTNLTLCYFKFSFLRK